ncbi:hypothetical protein [Salinicoccus kekensis]|uniref:Uncharacterized protein n=1 Tax=Salinicoccus kekensis TaxID=714307 RepID=A0A285UXU7_9STAP|nr:hypothetical protein [Salinicoccus kekensis]SOC45061.1 hypothetical protein SAMN05878391_2576 [Salinicoccus kekensis]
MALIDEKKVKQKKSQIKSKKRKAVQYDHTVLDILPYKEILDDDSALIVGTDNSYYQIFKVITHALNLSNQEEKNRLMMRFANFNRLMDSDYKIISTLFHIDNSPQKQYWTQKVNQAKNAQQRKYAMEQLLVLNRVEDDPSQKNQEHFLVINAKSKENMRNLVETLYRSHNGMIEPQGLSVQKKEQLIFRLNNQNTTR